MSGDTIINHLMYADDLVLISPSATGMKELLCACEVYSLEHAIIYNSKKSTLLVCRNKAMRQAVCPSFIVNGNIIPESDNVKYLGHIIWARLTKLYNWQHIVSPPHYRNDVHHPHDIICLYCRGLQDESEYIYFYIVYVSHLSSIDEYCRTFGSNTVILACLQTNIAHSNLLHKKSINCNQTI